MVDVNIEKGNSVISLEFKHLEMDNEKHINITVAGDNLEETLDTFKKIYDMQSKDNVTKKKKREERYRG